jgi:hypothetical protein
MTDLKPERHTEPPDTRLGNIAAWLFELLDAKEGIDDVKAIIFLNDRENAGMVLWNYARGDSEEELDDANISAVADIFVHLQAVFQLQGKELVLIPMPKPPGQG